LLIQRGGGFSKKSLNTDELFFSNERYVLFKKGILFTSGTHKGKALFKFLDMINYKPKSIIFVDDKKHCLMQVRETCVEHGVPFTGFRYGFLDRKVKDLKNNLVNVEPIDFSLILNLYEKVNNPIIPKS
jgi:hypothetical protein